MNVNARWAPSSPPLGNMILKDNPKPTCTLTSPTLPLLPSNSSGVLNPLSFVVRRVYNPELQLSSALDPHTEFLFILTHSLQNLFVVHAAHRVVNYLLVGNIHFLKPPATDTLLHPK